MESAPPSPGRSLLGIVLALVLALALVACVVGIGLFLWARQDGLNPVRAIQLRITLAQREDDLNTPAGTSDEYQRFVVNGGDSAHTIAANLLAQQLITDADLFVDYVQYHRLDSQLEAGTFYLRDRQTIPEIARALTDASAATVPFRTLPGWRLEEIGIVYPWSALALNTPQGAREAATRKAERAALVGLSGKALENEKRRQRIERGDRRRQYNEERGELLCDYAVLVEDSSRSIAFLETGTAGDTADRIVEWVHLIESCSIPEGAERLRAIAAACGRPALIGALAAG